MNKTEWKNTNEMLPQQGNTIDLSIPCWVYFDCDKKAFTARYCYHERKWRLYYYGNHRQENTFILPPSEKSKSYWTLFVIPSIHSDS